MNGLGGHMDGDVPSLSLPFPSLSVREPQRSEYRSQTASHLINKVAPTLMEKCEELAGAYEAELQEKDAEALDAERVVKKRQAKLEATRKQVAELMSMNNGLHIDLGDDEADQQQEEELQMLVEQ